MTNWQQGWPVARAVETLVPSVPPEIESERTGEARAAVAAPRPPERPKILLLAALYNLPYRVMLCTAACGVDVYVLGDQGARGLRHSRHCKKFFTSNHIISGAYDEGLALEISCLARDLDIAMVIPADAPSTRALIACRALLDVPCFPLPPLDMFDLLNDKWAFTTLCSSLGIRCPASRRFADVEQLAGEIARGNIAFPIVAKPLDMSGEMGCLLIDRDNASDRLKAINYKPIIVQQFIDGDDIGASIFARSGEIVALIAHQLTPDAYVTFQHDGIYADLARIAKHLALDGVYNFDMRLTKDGTIYYLECNPRFFYKINLSMVAGINFVGHGLPSGTTELCRALPDGVRVRMPGKLLSSPRNLLGSTRRDWRMLVHFYSDVAPRLLEMANLLP